VKKLVLAATTIVVALIGAAIAFRGPSTTHRICNRIAELCAAPMTTTEVDDCAAELGTGLADYAATVTAQLSTCAMTATECSELMGCFGRVVDRPTRRLRRRCARRACPKRHSLPR
jgi:hypothetical protein